jgi:hypothetical protein
MKKMLSMTMLGVLLFVASAGAEPETFSWSNPTMYVDGSAIPSAKQTLIKTHLFWGPATTGPWTEFAVVTGGATSYLGTPPAERGILAYYTLTAELDGAQSAYLTPAVSYTRPYIACNPPSGLTIK